MRDSASIDGQLYLLDGCVECRRIFVEVAVDMHREGAGVSERLTCFGGSVADQRECRAGDPWADVEGDRIGRRAGRRSRVLLGVEAGPDNRSRPSRRGDSRCRRVPGRTRLSSCPSRGRRDDCRWSPRGGVSSGVPGKGAHSRDPRQGRNGHRARPEAPRNVGDPWIRRRVRWIGRYFEVRAPHGRLSPTAAPRRPRTERVGPLSTVHLTADTSAVSRPRRCPAMTTQASVRLGGGAERADDNRTPGVPP